MWAEWAAPIFQRSDFPPGTAGVDQASRFTMGQNRTQRILSLASSCSSITMCLIAMYFVLAIDPRRFVFRHQLINFLILFDLLKAIILLIFPARIFTDAQSYYDHRFCQVIGFFTATAIEGADLAILAFAIHTFLLIFKPSLTVKIPASGRVEGGLYQFRYYVYVLSFLIPLVLASLPYAGKGYVSFVTWCYLPQAPVWYRLVLSWVPRYCIMIIILAVYCLIYFHVLREFRTLGGVFTTMHKLRTKTGLHPSALNQKPSFFSALNYFWSSFKDFVLPQFILPQEKTLSPHTTTSSSVDTLNMGPTTTSGPRDNPGGPLDTEVVIGDTDIQAANLENFRRRQRVIEKQMKSIFIYPFAYFLIWLFPFILQCTQFNYERKHGPVVWLNMIVSFTQSFNGVVDSFVFFYRERPWQYTVMKHFEREHSGKLDHFVMRNQSNGDLSSLDTNIRKSSLAVSMHVDVEVYSKWRRILSALHFPFMHLPTEDNIAKFLKSYINNRMDKLRSIPSAESGSGSGSGSGAGSGPCLSTNNRLDSEFSALLGKHDFSNLLSGGDEPDFRLNLNRFSFSGRRTSGGSASHSAHNSGGRRPSMVSISNKSNRSRRFSAMDAGAMPIRENDTYVYGNNTSARRSSDRSANGGEENELDILDFLRKGPV